MVMSIHLKNVKINVIRILIVMQFGLNAKTLIFQSVNSTLIAKINLKQTIIVFILKLSYTKTKSNMVNIGTIRILTLFHRLIDSPMISTNLSTNLNGP